MRKLLIAIALVGGIVSIALCGLYGWKQATAFDDKLIAAIQYGFVALLALVLDMVAIRAWVSGWHKSGGFIALAALGCFVMTATTSLGGMVTRSDAVHADRKRVLDTKQDAQSRITELQQEKKGLSTFKRTSKAAVDAAQKLADTASAQRKAECGEFNEKRGPLCKTKEEAETRALTDLATATTVKASTDRYDEIEAELKQFREKRATGTRESVGTVDPLGATMALLFGSVADEMTARQQAVFAVIFDIGLLALMVGIEVLGLASKKPDISASHGQGAQKAKAVLQSAPAKPRLVASNPTTPVGSVKRILTDNLEREPGQRVELADLASRYRSECRAKGLRTVTMDAFTSELGTFCKTVGITLKKDGRHLHLLDVRLAAANREVGVRE